MDIAKNLKVDKDNICRGCLSQDRVLKCLETDLDLLITLLGYSEACSSIYESPLLCWECHTLLCKIKKFQNRVKNAQKLLKKYLYSSEIEHLNTLSSLTMVKLETPSHVFDYEADLENKLVSENSIQISVPWTLNPAKPEEEESKPEDGVDIDFPALIKEEKDWTDCAWNPEDVNYSDGEIKKEASQFDIKTEKKRKKKQQGCEKIRRAQYNKRSIKVISVLDLSKSGQELFTVEVLSLEEMEKFAEEKDEEAYEKRKLNKKANKSIKTYKCKYCEKIFKKKEYLYRHRLMHHFDKIKNQLTCEECSTKCDSVSSLHSHWDIHNVIFTCTMCRVRYHNVKEMEAHVSKHNKLYSCVQCDVTLSSRFEVRCHFETYHNFASCDYCGKKYRTKEAIANHIRRNHVPMTCTLCQREFRNQTRLKRHHSSAHGWQVLTSGDLAYCVECNKQFKGRKQYLAHVTQSLKHAPNKKVSLPCPECGKQFSRRSYLNNHYKLFHLKKSNHYCPDCDKYYANADGLRKHRKSVHDKIPKEKNKICDICGRGFHTNRILTNHRRTHTGERPFQCSLCPHAFTQRVALEAHRRSQHKGAPVKEVVINSMKYYTSTE